MERHAATVRPPTIVTLSKRLKHATRAFGTVALTDLEPMRGEIAAWQARLPDRCRHGIAQALRQALEAAVRRREWLPAIEASGLPRPPGSTT